jgi:quercetin dioxygenase-like cupin family protein
MGIEYWYPEPGTELDEQKLREQLTTIGYHVTRYTYPPGSYFPDHTHSYAKIEVVLSGCFRMGMTDTFVDLKPGQAINIPEGSVHNAQVMGDSAVVCLDAVKQ